jgi:hypothetical protein
VRGCVARTRTDFRLFPADLPIGRPIFGIDPDPNSCLLSSHIIELSLSASIIEACRRRGLDPFAYLKDTFTRLPTATNWQIADLTLMPAAWAKANAARVVPRPVAA